MMTAWIVGEGLLYFFVVETKCLDARRHGVAITFTRLMGGFVY